MGRLALLLLALMALLAPVAAAAGGDRDRDGVDNRNERRQGTDPSLRDSDRDGRADGREDADRDGLRNAAEDATGNDPIDRDSDDDSVADGGEGAGTVSGYADGTLTIRLASGGLARGAVDADTELECLSERRWERVQSTARRASVKRGKSGRRRAGTPAAPRGDGEGSSGRRRAGASQMPGEDDDWDDEGDDSLPDSEDDEGWEDEDDSLPDSGDDEGWEDEDNSAPDPEDDESWEDDEDWEDEDGWEDEQAARSCPESSLRRGVAVHGSQVDEDDAGEPVFVIVELVR